MLSNSSIPRAVVIPVLGYSDVGQAAAWLCEAFGFTVRIRIGDHRVQLNVGDGAVIVRELRPHEIDAPRGLACSVTVRIDDADSHCARARNHNARIIHEPFTYPYGERQYTAEDLAGYTWTFSQSIADVPPEAWGGVAGHL